MHHDLKLVGTEELPTIPVKAQILKHIAEVGSLSCDCLLCFNFRHDVFTEIKLMVEMMEAECEVTMEVMASANPAEFSDRLKGISVKNVGYCTNHTKHYCCLSRQSLDKLRNEKEKAAALELDRARAELEQLFKDAT